MNRHHNPAANLFREFLGRGELLITPCCGDALTAKLIEQAGFETSFVSGFGIAASRMGLPDTGLLSFGEIIDQVRSIQSAVSFPLIVDADTGYGNELNVRRTIHEYAKMGIACVMIEDQVAPKRCGHTQGKSVIDFESAIRRVRAAIDAREELGDICILARTDALASHGIDEAIRRAQAFQDLGCEVTFVEAPTNKTELLQIREQVDGPLMANMLEDGLTPFLQPSEIEQMGYTIAAYPFTLLMRVIATTVSALRDMKNGNIPDPVMSFDALKSVLGFPEYYEQESRYASKT